MKYKKGIENLPLREINKKCPILVIIVDLKTDEVVEEFRLDYASYEDRKHMGRLTFWAVSHHHSIETMSMVDADQPYVEEK